MSGIAQRLSRRAALHRGLTRFALCLAAPMALPLLAAQPARAAAKPIKLLMLGDSITAAYGLSREDGLPAQLQAALSRPDRPVQVIDAGVSGDTTAGGRSRLDWALADSPDAVIVALGGNDGLRGIEPRDTEANLAAILDALKVRKVPALLAGMLAPPNLGADYGREFSSVFARLAKAHPEAVFYPFLLDGVAGDPALNQVDRIHPNPQGVKVLVARMRPAVEALIARIPTGPSGEG
ncbi:Lysophospholipase [Roseomonas mucosa]|uniref:Esterase TesA n=2 Tax=Roseomonadaceae TaxID=3385906 RepID=A0A379N3I5_9PROT|nr:arylesterase [Roseomonas mucosa]MBS5903469.1 arylesterase [Acetobacteraceae bacterium]MCG7350322.1 arylesterase [Roseomonas mucosa]MCG7356082.1 arylesterase [Roseomonas mucosa]MDT8290030.1 arylesterase [Roseomonas mucosa]MDT8293799.1 arylesterase [Roseomonas mucosa]